METFREQLVGIDLDQPHCAGREPVVAPYRSLFDLADRLAASYSGCMEPFAVDAECEMYIPAALTMIADLEAELSQRVFHEPLSEWLARRGLSLHRVRFEEDRVVDYRIMAPIQQKIYPGGIAVCCLSRIDVDNIRNAEAQSHLVVRAIDPCAACEVRIH